MKILYIGKFGAFHSTENYVTHALQKAGVSVVKQQFTRSLTLDCLKSQTRRCSPDFVLFSKPSLPCFEEFITWCRSSGLPTVTWIWDLYWGYRPSRPMQFYSDVVFSTDGGHHNHWDSHGINHHLLRQGIHEPEHVLYPEDLRDEIAFVGTTQSYRQRRQLAGWLRSTYQSRIKWHTRVRGLRLNRTLARTKIVVGDSYPAPDYWSNRVYEVLGRGGFLVFPETGGLDSEFKDGVHYVSYPRGDRQELKRLIEYYLKNDDKRETIRRAGFEKCGEYTYTTRAKKLLEHAERLLAGCKA